MASTDAKLVPTKNAAYRVTFPILDADGDLVTGATGLDSEVSKDGGTFADCTNEATEIATSSGIYYLDLTSTEMNADTVAVVVKTSSSGAKTTVLTFYPQESGDLIANATQVGGTAQTGGDLAALITTVDTVVDSILADTGTDGVVVAAGSKSGYSLTATTGLGNQTANITGSLSGSVGSVTGAVGSVTGDVGGNVVGSVGSVTGAVGSVTGAVGSVTGAVGSVTAGVTLANDAVSAAALSAAAIDEILDEQIGDGTITMRQALRVILAGMAGKLSGAATTTVTIRNLADSADVVVATCDSDGNRSAVTVTP